MKSKLTEEEKLKHQLEMDRALYGQSFEYLRDGKRERLDPRFVKCVRIKNEIIGGESPLIIKS